ncbi:MAG: hypothetical protein R2879_05205 [Saprospiraceae bacterium]
MSKIVHGRNRLGLHGASKPPGGNVKSIEVTAMENHKKGISTHHVYFKRIRWFWRIFSGRYMQAKVPPNTLNIRNL